MYPIIIIYNIIYKYVLIYRYVRVNFTPYRTWLSEIYVYVFDIYFYWYVHIQNGLNFKVVPMWYYLLSSRLVFYLLYKLLQAI